MNMSDLYDINKIIKKTVKGKYYIRIHTNLPLPFSPKAYNSDDIDENMIDDYLNGKVKNTSKFTNLYKIEIGYIK